MDLEIEDRLQEIYKFIKIEEEFKKIVSVIAKKTNQ